MSLGCAVLPSIIPGRDSDKVRVSECRTRSWSLRHSQHRSVSQALTRPLKCHSEALLTPRQPPRQPVSRHVPARVLPTLPRARVQSAIGPPTIGPRPRYAAVTSPCHRRLAPGTHPTGTSPYLVALLTRPQASGPPGAGEGLRPQARPTPLPASPGRVRTPPRPPSEPSRLTHASDLHRPPFRLPLVSPRARRLLGPRT